MHSIILPTHSRWLKVATKIELHLSWWRIAVKRRRLWSHWEALEIRGSNSSRNVATRRGQRCSSRSDRRWQTSCRESVKKCTQQPMKDWMQSAACSVPCRGSQQVLQKQYRISDLIPKSWDGSHDKGQLGTSWQNCACGCKRGQTRVNEFW